MSILFNNNGNPTDITYNGSVVKKVVYNGNTVWEAGNWVNVATNLTDSFVGSGASGNETKTYALPQANPTAIRITGSYIVSIFDQSGNFISSSDINTYTNKLLPISNDGSNDLTYTTSGVSLSVSGGYTVTLSGGYYVYRLYYVTSIDAYYPKT